VADAPGGLGFAGEIAMPRTNGGRVLYTQRARATETAVELEYDLGFSDAMTIDGITLVLRMPTERFAGGTVALRTGDKEAAVITLPANLEGYRIGTGEADRLDIAPDPEPLFSIAVGEPVPLPLPLRVPFSVVDLRPFHLDEFEVQIGGMMAAGQAVSVDTHYPLKLSLQFTGRMPLATVQPPETITRPGVRLCRDARVEQAFSGRVADVVSVAKQAYEALLPDVAKAEIRVLALPATSWHENLTTNRRDTIYLRVRDNEFGEAMRADAGPVGMLCQAVAELYNPGRFPGLDRFIAHRYLVPAVIDKLGAEALLRRHATPLAADGPEMLKAITSDAYAPVHPDFAAARALTEIEDKLGFDGLRALPHEVPADMQPDFAGFRAAAIARDPALAAAFSTYDRAGDIHFDNDDTHLIASFEPGETVKTVSAYPLRSVAESLVLTASPGFEVSASDEWATHGTHSLRVRAGKPEAGMYVALADPDWQFRDWRLFSRFEMDLILKSERPEELSAMVFDDIGGAHGQAPLFQGVVPFGEPLHLSCALGPEFTGQVQLQSDCAETDFRTDEVALLYIGLPHPTGQPVTLYIDNLRLIGGPLGAGGTKMGPRVPPPAGGLGPPPAQLLPR
jgi:hypothetical protein